MKRRRAEDAFIWAVVVVFGILAIISIRYVVLNRDRIALPDKEAEIVQMRKDIEELKRSCVNGNREFRCVQQKESER